jgi:RimJ/RimL family protein N-acetyltransferase
MEVMPYQPDLEPALPAETPRQTPPAVISNDWRTGLPCLTGSLMSLRELRASDAPALFSTLSSEQVSKFISPPPKTVQGFEKFIGWAIAQRQAGQFVCFAIVPHGQDTAVGLFQVRALDPTFETAEWGFVLAQECWGSGIFMDGAQLIVDFAFEVLGVHRLEARASVKNGRGNGALRKLGAVQECVLRRSFERHGEFHDQALWTILDEDWLECRTVRVSPVTH